jgi:hypothetical protein
MEIDKSGVAPRIAMTRETSPKEMAENRKNKVTERVIPARRKNPNALGEQTNRIFFGNILYVIPRTIRAENVEIKMAM